MKIKIQQPTKAVNSEIFYNETGFNLTYEDGEFYLSGEATEEQLNDAYAAHNPPAPKEPTVAEKLASVGLSLEELREALGSN